MKFWSHAVTSCKWKKVDRVYLGPPSIVGVSKTAKVEVPYSLYSYSSKDHAHSWKKSVVIEAPNAPGAGTNGPNGGPHC